MEELYKQNFKIVYHYLCSLCHDEQLSEELAQETFLRAYKSMERFDGSCKISTWLCQIGKHIYFQHLQKNKHEIPLEQEEKKLESFSRPEQQILNRLELMDVLKEMQKLPSTIREVIYLRVMSELSYREIGEILGKSENWARVNFYRAKEILLKERMKNE